jgi:hypothetical protein
MINKKLCLVYLFIICLITANNCWSADIYVDKTISSNCANYDPLTRTCISGSYQAYKTIKEAITAMSSGDDIYVREGTYQENNTSIPLSKNGTSDKWSSIQSYPGEWAILDGNHVGGVLGHYADNGTTQTSHSNDFKYWKFERLEIKNGDNAGASAGGIFGVRGPLLIRDCYIHDNIATSGGNNPAGINIQKPQNVTIEYCLFKDNGMTTGSSLNCSDIIFFGDYIDSPVNVNIEYAMYKNVIRYNYFAGGSIVGIHYKGHQWLCIDNHLGTDLTYKTYGDKIYNNIFIDQGAAPILASQDFIQIYKNIFVSIGATKSVLLQTRDDGRREPFYAVVNNNLFNNVSMSLNHANHDSNLGRTYDIPTATAGHPYFYFYNNILENMAGINLNLFFTYSSWNVVDIDTKKIHVENNLFYPRSSSDSIIRIAQTSYAATTFISGGYANTLYPNSTAGLHSSGYKTEANFEMASGKTIGSGGIGTKHPYLDGVTLPSYLGAVNPNTTDSGLNWDPNNPNSDDAGWVDYIINIIGNINQLKLTGISLDKSTSGSTGAPTNLRVE